MTSHGKIFQVRIVFVAKFKTEVPLFWLVPEFPYNTVAEGNSHPKSSLIQWGV